MSEVRLQKILARSGAGSRRACEKLIEVGRVTVNGRVAQLGQSADASVDDVRLDGKRITLRDERVVVALNKPCGYLSAMSDDRGRRCASELLPLERWPSLFHVGRLDADTSGLLLFTTDGDLGQALAHPSHEVQKEYVCGKASYWMTGPRHQPRQNCSPAMEASLACACASMRDATAR